MTKTKTQPPTKTGIATPPTHYASCGIVVGIVSGTSCWVSYPENPSAQAQKAWVLNHVGEVEPGQTVLLQFLSGDVARPIVAGVMPGSETSSTTAPGALQEPTAPATLEINGEKLALSAQQSITLRCGKASLTMKADGTIEIRGTELLSRSSGQNAIRGASVSLN